MESAYQVKTASFFNIEKYPDPFNQWTKMARKNGDEKIVLRSQTSSNINVIRRPIRAIYDFSEEILINR